MVQYIGLDYASVKQLSHAVLWALVALTAAVTVKLSLTAIYNLYFHPLHRFPGPKLAAATPLPFAWRIFTGRMVHWTDSLHREYGGVVRIHPDELSFVEALAWKDIYASRPQLPKPELGELKLPNGVSPIASITKTEDHTRQRRILSHAFSERAVREQEYLLQKYSDLLITRLNDQCKSGKPEVDMCDWYNFTTFDIIGDLCFGESFHSLEHAKYHSWVSATFQGVKIASLLTIFQHFPPMAAVIDWCVPKSIREKGHQHFLFSKERIKKRIAQKSDRPDFMKFILENNHQKGMSRDEIDSTVTLLVLAGSETSSTTLTSATWFSLKDPKVMNRLQKEVRQAFKAMDKITVASVSDLPYLHAVLQEGLRMHPPGPVSVPRLVDRPGVEIAGIPVPQGTRVGIPQKTAYRSSDKFADPESFAPERWLPDADVRFAKDDRAMFEPFMVGPRNCIGKSLAWAEMKLILAKVIWSFDLELTKKNAEDWSDQRVYLLNEKTPMYVRLKARNAK